MGTGGHLSLSLIAVLYCGVCYYQCSAALHGVDPALRERYAGQSFTCVDGSKTVDLAKVNDNYCDCVDGSDEPGTSACPRGSFYCRNFGYTPKKISSSFVNDGVCDCCDGSDEYEQFKTCENKCIDLGKSIREAVMLQAAAAEQGVKAKEVHLLKASETLKRWEAELQTATQAIESLKPSVDALNAKYTAAKEAFLRRKAEEKANLTVEEGTQEDPPQENAEHTAVSEPAVEAAEFAEEQATVEETEEERGQRIAQQWTTNVESAGEVASGAPAEESEEERGKRIASQWTTNEESAGVEVTVDEPEEGIPPDVIYDDEGNVMYKKPPEWNDEEDGVWEPPDDISEEEVEDIKAEYDEMKQKLQSLENQKGKLQKNMENDYGPNKEFLHLVDQCLEVQVNQYTYKVCAFDKAEQAERGAGTSLGKWEGFKDSYTKMAFTGGATCWNGPARSLQVNLKCGDKDVLTKVEEPSRCEYVADLYTPAVCSAESLASLKKQVDQMLRDVERAQAGHEELR